MARRSESPRSTSFASLISPPIAGQRPQAPAAAVMAPMRHGHRLTFRSALNVVLSSEFPRSVRARVAACSAVTVR